MKKVRMIVSAVAVFAVVGSALAFKAKSFGEGNVFCSSNACTNQPLTSTIAINDPSGAITDPCSGGDVFIAGDCNTAVDHTSHKYSSVAQ